MAAVEDDNTVASCTLTQATAEDIPALVQVHTAAFRSDLFSHLMLLDRPDGAHQALMRKSIEHWLADPRSHVIKAVDANGQVLGWACWVLQERARPAAKAEAPPAPDGETAAPPPAAATGPDKATDPARALGGRMREDAVRHEAKHLDGRGPHLVLQGLATAPGLQGRGLGTRLVRWGTDRADAEGGLPCWAHASPAGRGLYARSGFAEVGRDDYDLAAWAPGGQGGGRGWGTYTFRYMLRPGRQPAELRSESS